MGQDRKRLLISYYRIHRNVLNNKFLRVSFLYLFLSIIWNSLFLLFNLPYSRADLSILFVCLVVWLCIVLADKYFRMSSLVMQHVIMWFSIFIVISLYYGSGYTESWSFFLILPFIAGLYGEKHLLMIYSTVGCILLYGFSSFTPLPNSAADMIDISNRILLYIILATFSFLMFGQFSRVYNKQVNIIIDSMETTIEQVVKSFIIAVEAKDTYTFGHSERVSKYAVALAQTLPEFKDQKILKTLRLTALLHDIGKINIPESVLTKPSALTEEEYALIKTHTIAGGRMMEQISGLGALKPGVLYHHERWDGKGYPVGLKQNEIPLDARILAVADAFDAVTSNRSYREAMDPEEGFRILVQGRGTQFDPYLIDRLEAYKEAWLEVYNESRNDIEELERITDLV
jgi:hypothetical protein